MEIDDNVASGLVVGYWKHHRLGADKWAWAWDRVDQLMRARHPDSVSILCRLSDAARTEEELGYPGAGPLEDLIHQLDIEPDPVLAADLDAALERNPRLVQALHGVVFTADSTMEARLQRFLHR